ncbi:MAG: hypothetical protein C0467_07055 [Planctomycetaceae bacterium]|nr:hypothetical protein [Planctomycetaceae bacterium]
MRCAQCRGPDGQPVKLEVVGTRQRGVCATKRYRRCPVCGHKVTTIEQPTAGQLPTLTAAATPKLRT